METHLQERDSGRATLTVSGRLDLLSAAGLRQAVADAVARGITRLVVDLSQVTFLDSSGAGALIAGLRLAREAGGELRIAGLGEQPLTVLRLTTLDRILRPYPDADAALEGM